MKARFAALREQLTTNAFQRPLYLESHQTSGELRGDIYALSGLRFEMAGPALQGIDRWCDILILHLNVKGCRTVSSKAGDVLKLNVGRKTEQALADTYDFEFQYAVIAYRHDYMRATLEATAGPLGTRDYRIALEIVALDEERTFLHVSYSYAYGMAARMAMQGYLATSGRNKAGFSIVSRKATGQPVYIGGMRGVVERNTMRYYLAIEAYLGALSTPTHQRLAKRLEDWYASTARYPAQLHEIERDEYLAMKHKEVARQETADSTAATIKRNTG